VIVDLEHFWPAIRRYGWLILVMGLTAGAVAFVLSQLLPRSYESESGVLVGSLTETRSDELLAYQRLAQTYAEIGTSSPVMLKVIERLGIPETPAELAKRIQLRALTGQAIVRITATAPNAPAAVELANTVAEEIAILAQPTTPPGPSLASVYQPATVPTGPASPRVVLNAAVGALLGLAIGLGLALYLGRPEAPPGTAGQRAGAGRKADWPA
jgi:polysaccharide biosynthesis transport protein